MENLDLYLKNLTGKDEVKAQQAACFLIDNCNVDLFKLLVEKMDFLFDFVRNNVNSRIEKAVNKTNFMNIVSLFCVYSSYFDDLFASILAMHANEDVTDKIFELLEKGSIEQKRYSAKYFYYIPDTVALEPLSKYAFSDDEALSYNAAEALGQMQDDISFDIALGYLKSDDDFDKLKAVKFFAAYGKKYPFNDIFDAMKSSKIPENIAGQIPYMCSPVEFLNMPEYIENILYTFNYIISGLGEILPLSDIFQFELYEFLENLINKNKSESKYSGLIAEILLKSLSKFNLFSENQEYVFDEDKNTKKEISDIHNLLTSQTSDFWNMQKKYIISELTQSKERILSVLSLFVEFNIVEAVNNIKNILSYSNDEIVLCECLSSLKGLNSLNIEDINSTLTRIKNPNIIAIIDNLKY